VTEQELAYIAGFLDGDGCVMLQLVYRHDYVLGYQIRSSIVFYQKTEYLEFLEWLKRRLKVGYLRNRNDEISELTIVGIKPVTQVLEKLYPYLRLKKRQAKISLEVMKQMPGTGKKMRPKLLMKLAREVDRFADLNYSKRRMNTSKKLYKYLVTRNLLDPVETDP
jgi:hypothetical protein